MLMQLCDRIIVMCGGAITGVVDPRAVTKEKIGELMMRHENDRSEEVAG